MPADGISLPFTIAETSARPVRKSSSLVEIMNTPPPIQKATFCRTYASAKSRHWSGRAVGWSSCPILLSRILYRLGAPMIR